MADSEKSPAFQFFPKDFLSSEKVLAMSNTEVGIYIKLLAISWLNGGLPSDISRLATLVRVDKKRFARMWPYTLAGCFVERDGVLINERLESERQKQAEYRARMSEQGKLGGRPKKPKVSPSFNSEKPKVTSSFPESKATESSPSPYSSTYIEGASESQPDLQVWFTEFLALYPEQRRRQDLLTQQAWCDAFTSLPESQWPAHFALLKTRLANHVASEQWAERNVIPSMHKWLAEKRWVQELPPSGRVKAATFAPVRTSLSPATEARIRQREQAEREAAS